MPRPLFPMSPLTNESLPLPVGLCDLVGAAHLAVRQSADDEDHDAGTSAHFARALVLVPVAIAGTARRKERREKEYWTDKKMNRKTDENRKVNRLFNMNNYVECKCIQRRIIHNISSAPFLFMNVIKDSSLSHLVAVEVLEEAVRVEMYGYCFVSSLSSMASYNQSEKNVKTETLKPNKEPDSQTVPSKLSIR